MPSLRTTLSLLLAALAASAAAGDGKVTVIVQRSPLAGSQYYALSAAWGEIRPGDKLLLTRETDNRHDSNAICVEWDGCQIGNLPRQENRAPAAAMDRGERVEARLVRLHRQRAPWQRVEFEAHLVL